MTATGDEHASEPDGASLMAEGAARLVDGVTRLGEDWVVRAVMTRIDQWGHFDAQARARVLDDAATAGSAASARVAGELRALFARPPRQQAVTPLEIIRSLRVEATAVLRAAGVPEVERDRYEERSFPDDVYGIVLRTPVELGDEALGGALLAWGLGKARSLRAERTPDSSPPETHP
jgi:hypothetical protein